MRIPWGRCQLWSLVAADWARTSEFTFHHSSTLTMQNFWVSELARTGMSHLQNLSLTKINKWGVDDHTPQRGRAGLITNNLSELASVCIKCLPAADLPL
jgi:hypothetical protein